MSHRRFSDQQLRYLRNRIPIASVITSISSDIGKRPRFVCPLCAGRDTAINETTNLARCFGCNKNFNPIEMVMAVQRLSFVDAVGLLLEKRQQLLKTVIDHQAVDGSSRPPALRGSTAPNASQSTALGEIIPSVINGFRRPPSQKKCCDGCRRLEQSLEAIQRRLSLIENLVDRLRLSKSD